MPFNPYQASSYGGLVDQGSSTISLDFVDANGDPIDISKTKIELIIPRDLSVTPSEAINNETAEFPADSDDTLLFYHQVETTKSCSAFHADFVPENKSVQFLVLIGYNSFPKLKEPQYFQFHRMLPALWIPGREAEESDFRLFISDSEFDHVGTVYLGVRQLSESEYNLYTEDNPPPTPADGTGRFTTRYTLQSYSTTCAFMDEDVDPNHWSCEGMSVGRTSNRTAAKCYSTHLSTFGGGWAVQPNTIDFDYVFANLDFARNVTLYVTEIIIFIVFIGAAIWARREDKKDQVKLGVTPLPDNDPEDKYLYEVVVYTGMRKNAGTDSKVHIILSGEFDETDVRILEDSKRKVFRRGECDTFLLAVPRPLGALNYIRIWHDNSGKGKFTGWYLKHIMLHDLQTREKYYFIANRWFAVEEDDGQVDRLIAVATRTQLVEFKQLFSQTTSKNLGDGHLWFSVVARPPQSRFTRLQRVAACLCLLYTSMLANAMFYERTPSKTGQGAYTIGPFAFTPEQLYVGVISNLVVFPVNFIIVTLFRKARPRRLRNSRIQEALKRGKEEQAKRKKDKQNKDTEPILGDSPYRGDPYGGLGYDEKAGITTISRSGSIMSQGKMDPFGNPNVDPFQDDPYAAFNKNELESYDDQFKDPYAKPHPLDPYQGKPMDVQAQKSLFEAKKAKKKPFSLPWWFVYVGWVLLFLSVGVSAAFVTFYGIQFGDEKTKKWITSLFISFVTSIFLTQPVKVFLVAVFISLLFKKPNMEDEEGEEDEQDHGLEPDEVWLHQIQEFEMYGNTRPRKIAYKPPDPVALEKARINRLKELKMYAIIREIIFYAFFLWILMVISYGFRDPNAHHYKFHLSHEFGDQGLHQVNTFQDSYMKVRNTKQFWSWAKNTLVPALRARKWYNGQQPVGQRGFASDRTSRMMGYGTVRQLRIKKGECTTISQMRATVPECNVAYSFFKEEKEHYGIGWEPFRGNETFNNSRYEYRYRTADELDGYPYWAIHGIYGGGGYVMNLRGTVNSMVARMDELESEEWIDKYTRAIFIEFTVYNAQINLFGIVTYVAEFLESAGVFPQYRVEPVNLLSYYTGAMAFQIFCEVVYLIFIVVFIVKETRTCIRLGYRNYFSMFWTWVEIAIIGMSIGATVIYFYRMILSRALVQEFKDTHGNEYMKFQYVGYWNELLLYMVAWLVFLATLKFLRLLRFNRKMSLLASTLKHAAVSLFHFSIMFGVIFFAFAQFFYLLYFVDLDGFKTFIHASETCLQMILGRFNFFAMKGASPVVGPMFFFIYVITVGYILINMFITILNESFASVRHDVSKQNNDYEMVEFIMTRFKQWTGISQPTNVEPELPPDDNRDSDQLNNLTAAPIAAPMKPAFEVQIDNFPEKVDRLLSCISKVYFDTERFDRMFKSHQGKGGKDGMKMMMKDNVMKSRMAMLMQQGKPKNVNNLADVEENKDMTYF